MVLTLIILVIIAILGIILIGIGFDTDELAPGLFGLLLIIISVLGAVDIRKNNSSKSAKPTALDVYRGRTTLQVTYKDSIPVDTIVVFK